MLTGADDADRVLLIGNGCTHRWGTLTHELALTGQLGRTLSRASGIPTDVSYVGDEMMGIASVIPWLRETRLRDYDPVLLVLSMNDAVRLTPGDEYYRIGWAPNYRHGMFARYCGGVVRGGCERSARKRAAEHPR